MYYSNFVILNGASKITKLLYYFKPNWLDLDFVFGTLVLKYLKMVRV